MPSVHDLITVFQVFFPLALTLDQALLVFTGIIAVLPLYKLHRYQQRQPQQRVETAWYTAIVSSLSILFNAENNPDLRFLVPEAEGQNRQPETLLSRAITNDLEQIYELLGIEVNVPDHQTVEVIPKGPQILVTPRLNCAVCPHNEVHALRKKDLPQKVRLLDQDFSWREAFLFVAHCPVCRSDYYPDKYTYKVGHHRYQKLEYTTEYLRVSKSGIWVHRSIAIAQERAISRFHCGWSNFATWLNDIVKPPTPKITNRQAQRLYLEHCGRRLLIFHDKMEDFECEAHPTSAVFANTIRDTIGRNGGRIFSALHHGCQDCTHRKRYRADLIREGAVLDGAADGVADIPPDLPINEPQVCT